MKDTRDEYRCPKCGSTHTHLRVRTGVRICYKCGHEEKIRKI